ncbi:MAG: hypothetical protein E7565_06155 [Ruminococcaceae bacterium]|nr:hypothetical protein [Oscillospiraceae bacterium]
MKTKIKNLLCLVLAIAMLTCLCACAGQSVPKSVNEEGEFIYSITRPVNASSEEELAAKDLRLKLKKTFDCKITLNKDKAVEDYKGNYEILIGDTNREESEIAKQRLIDNHVNCSSDFIIKVIGEKICIQAVNDEMLTLAEKWFEQTFCENIEDWALLTKNYEFIYSPEIAPLNNVVAGVDLSNFTVVLPRKTSILHGLIVDEYITLYDQHDYELKEAEDFDAEAEYEILVGDCNRTASQNVTVEGDNYVIKVVGKKLVIKGGNHLATWRGFKAFLDEVKKAENGESGINWADGYTVNGKYDAAEKDTFTLNWNDEFEGSAIDLNKWSDYRNDSQSTAASCLGGTVYQTDVHGDSAYEGSAKNGLIYQADGKLVCATKRVDDKNFIGSTVSTYWTMTWKYGAMDIYGKLAPEPAYTTYWANGAATSGEDWEKRFGGKLQSRTCMTEIDILENYSKPDWYGSTVHWWWGAVNSDGTKGSGSGHAGLGGNSIYKDGTDNSMHLIYDKEKYGGTLPDDYHMYSFYWDDKCIKFAFDGKVFMNYQYTNHESVSVHCLMNYFISSCAMGSPNYGYTYNKDLYGDYYEHSMDYVRIYQTDAVNSQMITAWPEKKANGTSKIFYPDNTIGAEY